MDTLENKQINFTKYALIAVILFGAIALPYKLYALVNYPASAGLGVGTVQTRHILDGGVKQIDLDLTQNFRFTGLSVATSTATSTLAVHASSTAPALSIVQQNEGDAGDIAHFYASTTPVFFIKRDGKIGIGTSSPATVLSVQGDILTSGSLSVGNLTATGTTKLGGITYTWPSADGSNTNVLQTNGAGTLSWAAAGDWLLLASTTLTANSISITAEASSTRKVLKITFDSGTQSVNGQFVNVTFNGDSGNNYNWMKVTHTPATTAGDLVAFCTVTTLNHGVHWSVTMDGIQLLPTRKLFHFAYTGDDNGNAATGGWGSCMWRNTTDLVTKVTFAQNDGTTTMPPGAVLNIWGSAQ